MLQVGREALEVLRVRQYGDRDRAEEIVVPDRDQRHQHRQVALERRVTEMHVHFVEAGEHVAEVVRADRDHRRQADRRVHRVAPADPVPERSEEHTSELQSLMRISYAVFCLKKKTNTTNSIPYNTTHNQYT